MSRAKSSSQQRQHASRTEREFITHLSALFANGAGDAGCICLTMRRSDRGRTRWRWSQSSNLREGTPS